MVERGPEKAGVASPILALGTLHTAAVAQQIPLQVTAKGSPIVKTASGVKRDLMVS